MLVGQFCGEATEHLVGQALKPAHLEHQWDIHAARCPNRLSAAAAYVVDRKSSSNASGSVALRTVSYGRINSLRARSKWRLKSPRNLLKTNNHPRLLSSS